jgi:Predicted dioxygenase
MNAIKICSALVVIIVILTIAPVAIKQGELLACESSTATDGIGNYTNSCSGDLSSVEGVGRTGGILESGKVASDPKLSCKYYVDSDFKRSVSIVKQPEQNTGSKLIGGIVTHHLLADSLIAPFFSAITTEKPELVFIVGPNHKRLGQEKINTGSWDWQTPFGVLEADHDVVKSLVENLNAGENFELMEEEHSISSLVPYVKYYLPDARIVPILLHGNYGMKASVELAKVLRKIAGDRSWIVVGSIDFSHYLTPEAAGKMDDVTLEAIREGDMKAISDMGNDNLDSPPTLITLLSVMKDEGNYEMKVTGHSNSSKIAGIYSESTTSYFTMLFYEK